MKAFFEFHSKLDLFRPFSAEHLVTIAIIFILCILLFVFRKELMEKGNRRLFRFSLAFLILAANVLYHLWLVYEHAWSVKRALPLQLSDLAALLAILLLLTTSYRIFQFMYFAGLGSAIQAILTPDLYKFSFPHFLYFQSFVSHGGVVLACLFMVVAFHYRPTIRSMWMTILIVSIYGVCVFFLNKLLGSNYLYIMRKEGMVTPLNFFGPWPWYILTMELAMILSFYILYIPFWIKRKKDKGYVGSY
jgi:hypothetical integral membrane protein (TIGR02206 family)